MSGHGAPTVSAEGHGLRVAVVAASWHEEVMDGLVAGALRGLADSGVEEPLVVRVPGTVELGVACARLAPRYDALVALGVVVRGGTPHFDYVCQSATAALTEVAVRTGVPVGFGVLTCDDDAQARRPRRPARVQRGQGPRGGHRGRRDRRDTARRRTARGGLGVNALRELLAWIQHESVTVAGYPLPWIEVVGNLFGFASAILGMRRKVWAWPIGIVGNLLLFVIFVSATFDAAARTPLFGQAGRQVFFIITSLYGWWRWQEHKRARIAAGAPDDTPAITPRWALPSERTAYVLAWVGLVLVTQWALASVGAAWPAPRWYFWCDAWILVGSMLATYAMARGWNDFWLMWIAVDLVGVPLLWHSGYYPTAVLYAVYGGLVLYGFFVWLRASRTEQPDPLEARELDPVG